MCTIVSDTCFKIAEKDIPCFKMTETLLDLEGKPFVVTPFAFKHLTPDILRGDTPLRPDDWTMPVEGKMFTETRRRIIIGGGTLPLYVVSGGVIHTLGDLCVEDLAQELVTLTVAIDYRETYLLDEHREHLPECAAMPFIKGVSLYRCVIPAGTLYLDGADDDMHRCYISKEIRFMERICDFTDDDFWRRRACDHEEIVREKLEKIDWEKFKL